MKRIDARNNGARAQFPCRLSYCHLTEPWDNGGGNSDKKYSVSCIIPKEDKQTLEVLKAAVKAAVEEGKAKKWGGKVPSKLSLPLRDGDEERENDPAYAESIFMSANSKRPVAVANRLLQPIDAEEAYSGCYALVSVNFFPYDTNGNKGIGAGLNAVVKTGDGERLGGGSSGLSDFEGMDLEDEGLDILDNL